MLTFNIQAIHSDNYYCGFEPDKCPGSCWSDREHALVMTIEQAREFVAAWPGDGNIAIAVVGTPAMSPYEFNHELFCIRGGNWHHWPHRVRLARQKSCDHYYSKIINGCVKCGAKHKDDYWYDPTTETTILETVT